MKFKVTYLIDFWRYEPAFKVFIDPKTKVCGNVIDNGLTWQTTWHCAEVETSAETVPKPSSTVFVL